MTAARAFSLPSYREDDLAAAGAKMLSRSVQKMSAKLIRSAIAPLGGSQRNRSKPTKSVHFEAHLESVCYFMKDDEPCLIAARISAVKRTHGDYNPLKTLNKESPALLHDSTCVLDMISQSADRAADAPVRVEQLYLSNQKSVTGTLAVTNFSFAQRVKVRFTLDGWKTVSETAAEYSGNHRHNGFDTFGFTISLEDQHALKDKTMSFCVCYVANGKEFKEDNGSMNYQVELSKLARQACGIGSIEPPAATQTASSPAMTKTRPSRVSPPGILRLTMSGSRPSNLPTASTHTSLFGSFSRHSKAETESTDRKQGSRETVQDAPLWKYMDRLSTNATTLSSRQIRLL
ncbi:predicted protein [Uncinocarpus reesii 1704]|uniref:CBM21 domain-containing protein n=1 Tax=Uncinocarpus reesii (strain UAMH 1704) TaxID=336963 RepID=C4JXU4_UNCRE|nr:uncharacterized protein UREG_07882 [Uncinocarpus reesii 1704]EEP83017.1 predicted protein [Uncinocarpus reesii 1704]